MAAQEKSLQIVQPAPVSPMNVETLMLRALESNVSIDSLERLMAMRRELVAEGARTAFFSALAGFQAECPVIPKTGEVRERGGQQVRYRFAPLDKIVSTIRPHLEAHGLSYTFNAVFDLDNHHLIAVCEVHHALGHTEQSEFRVPISKDNFMNSAQHFGSASSYARRYALCNALGLLTGDEDDDAQAAPPQTRPAQPQRAQERAAAPEPSRVPPPPPSAPQEPASGNQRELLEQVTARCVELGYDTATQLKARSKAARMTEDEIKTKVLPSLDRLIEQRRKEESRLRTVIYKELNELYKSDAEITAFLQKNAGGVEPQDMHLEDLKALADMMEIK